MCGGFGSRRAASKGNRPPTLTRDTAERIVAPSIGAGNERTVMSNDDALSTSTSSLRKAHHLASYSAAQHNRAHHFPAYSQQPIAISLYCDVRSFEENKPILQSLPCKMNESIPLAEHRAIVAEMEREIEALGSRLSGV